MTPPLPHPCPTTPYVAVFAVLVRQGQDGSQYQVHISSLWDVQQRQRLPQMIPPPSSNRTGGRGAQNKPLQSNISANKGGKGNFFHITSLLPIIIQLSETRFLWIYTGLEIWIYIIYNMHLTHVLRFWKKISFYKLLSPILKEKRFCFVTELHY